MSTFLTTEEQAPHLAIAKRLTGSKEFRDDAQAIAGYTHDEGTEGAKPVLRAIAVIEKMTLHETYMHFAAVERDWRPAELGFLLFAHLFEQRHFKRVRVEIADWHSAAQVTALKTGFRFEARLRASLADGSDAIVMSLVPEHCRWLQDVATLKA